MKEVEVQYLVYLIRQGNQYALDQLMLFSYQYIKSLLYKRYSHLLKVINEEELLQEAIISVEKCIYSYRYDSEAAFLTFITLCSTRRWYSMIAIRKSKLSTFRHAEISLDQVINTTDSNKKDITILETIADSYPTHNPQTQLYVQEKIEHAYHIIDSANDHKVKKLFQLKSEGYTESEISKILGVNEKWVANTVYRYRKKFCCEEY